MNSAFSIGVGGTAGGESGHVVVQEFDGAHCGCGGCGCLEQCAPSSAFVRIALEIMGSAASSTSQESALLAEAGDALARKVFIKVGHALAIGLTGLINTLNLPLSLIGVGVSDAWDLFAATMLDGLHRRSYIYRFTEPDILKPINFALHKIYSQCVQHGMAAGLFGACLLPFQLESLSSPTPEIVLAHQ